MINFEDAIQQVDIGERPSILLGNGFSRAWKNDIFDYANLLQAANFGAREREIREIFHRMGTYDFETVMRTLMAAKTVLESYGGQEAVIELIENDQELLKAALIAAVSNTHPESSSDVLIEQFTAARRFLSRFQDIFTVNYDLLFYWARNQRSLPPENYLTDDGFRAGRRWKGYGTNQEVHFLHGDFTYMITVVLSKSISLERKRALDAAGLLASEELGLST